jgi:hypothetical protein
LPNSYLVIIDYFRHASDEIAYFEQECWQARAIAQGLSPDYAKELIDYGNEKMLLSTCTDLMELAISVGFKEAYRFFQANTKQGFLLKK